MKIIYATLVGSVLAFLLGWLVFGILMDPYYQANMVHYSGLMKDEDTMRLYGIFLANLTTAGLFAYVFEKWAGIRSLSKGFVGGVILGGAMFLSFDLMMWSTMNVFPSKVFAVDVIVNALFGGIIGAAIGWVLGYGRSAA